MRKKLSNVLLDSVSSWNLEINLPYICLDQLSTADVSETSIYSWVQWGTKMKQSVLIGFQFDWLIELDFYIPIIRQKFN